MNCDWCGDAGCEECTGSAKAGDTAECDWCSGAGCDECSGGGTAAAANGSAGGGSESCDWCEGVGCDECSGKGSSSKSSDGWAMTRTASVEATSAAPWKVLHLNNLEGVRKHTVSSMAEQLDVTEDEADCLLRFYDWDQAKLTREWFQDSNAVRNSAGVLELHDNDVYMHVNAGEPPSQVPCVVALCEPGPKEDATRLGCGHWVCNEHWQDMLTIELNTGMTSVLCTCPGMRCTDSKCNHLSKQNCNCKQLVPQSLIHRFVKDEALKKKYQGYISRRFVEAQKSYRWCITPGCECVLYYEGGGVEEAECKCGRKLCVACGENPHFPAPCDLAGKFLATKNSDQATMDLIAATCKQCPKCGVQIQKMEHCSHMNCTNCSHEFCWLCKGPWKSHNQSFFECKEYEQRVKDGLVSSEEARQVQKQQDLQKFEYYYKLWDQHRQGLTLCEELTKIVRNGEATQRMLLLDGLTKLAAAHKTLQWTWCLVYFMAPGANKVEFTLHQTQLSEKCEELTKNLRDNGAKHYAYYNDPGHANSFRAAVSSLSSHRQDMIAQIESGSLMEALNSKAGVTTTMDGWACTRCGKLHGPGEARATPPASAVSWTCKHCTFYNEHPGGTCEMCGTDRGASASSPQPSHGQKRLQESSGNKNAKKHGFLGLGKSKSGGGGDETKSPALSPVEPSSPTPSLSPPAKKEGSAKKKTVLEPGQVPMEWCAECAACRRHGEKECHACVT